MIWLASGSRSEARLQANRLSGHLRGLLFRAILYRKSTYFWRKEIYF